MNLAPPLACVSNILQVICDADDAVGGVVQLVGDDSLDLYVAAQHGLSDKFHRHLKQAHPGDGTPCSQALIERRRVVVRDVEVDGAYEPHRALTLKEGIRAIQSTPLINGQRHSLGVLTTFYPRPQHPSTDSLAIIDRCAEIATQTIEANRLEARLNALSATSGMPHRPVSDEVARSGDAAKGLLRSLTVENFASMLPAASQSLKRIVEELTYQVTRQEV